jgi:hypothetical protein
MMKLDMTAPIVKAIYERYEDNRRTAHRPHLGGSQIGNSCSRALWYQFRWAYAEQHEGRILRLFETGEREELRVIQNLRAAGCTVWDRDPGTGQQFRYTAVGGHFALSLDGVVEGLPESSQPHTLEVKTMSEKYFKVLCNLGVTVAKPVYYAQCQIGMHLSGLDRCLFIVVNKNTDEIYAERLKVDHAFAEELIEKAGKIIFAERPPLGISNDPAWFECKFCPYHSICHDDGTAELNCRTCAFSTAEAEGWTCARHKKALDEIDQRSGCGDHIYNPALVKLPVHDSGEDFIDYINEDGEIVRNKGREFKSV